MSTRNPSAATVRACADALIELAERAAKGWDRGMYRDDDAQRIQTIRQERQELVRTAMHYAPLAM